MQLPSIMNAVDASNRISSKWISKETGKSHKNVLRDIETLVEEDNSSGSDLSQTKDARQRITECFLPIATAVVLLGRYTGPRAIAARRLMVEAVNYFIYRAPFSEKRIRDLEEENAWLRRSRRRQSLTSSQGPSKVLVRVLIDNLLPGFEAYFVDRYVSPGVASNMPQERETAKLSHLRRTEAGVSKKRKKQEDFVLGALN